MEFTSITGDDGISLNENPSPFMHDLASPIKRTTNWVSAYDTALSTLDSGRTIIQDNTFNAKQNCIRSESPRDTSPFIELPWIDDVDYESDDESAAALLKQFLWMSDEAVAAGKQSRAEQCQRKALGQSDLLKKVAIHKGDLELSLTNSHFALDKAVEI